MVMDREKAIALNKLTAVMTLLNERTTLFQNNQFKNGDKESKNLQVLADDIYQIILGDHKEDKANGDAPDKD